MAAGDAKAVLAGSFGAVAAQYERGRPPYPADAVEWLVPPGAGRLLDLGAGTGKLTRQLRHRAPQVLAIDPSAGMLAELARAAPGVPAIAGTAELLPLRDGAVDAVLVAQAWHWVDDGRAVPEIARVLRPGGRLGLVWNIRDEREEWVAELGRIIHRGAGQELDSASPRVGPPFAPVERLDIEWTRQLTLTELLDTVASRSYVITLPPRDRAAVLASVAELVHRHPALTASRIPLPYITRCSRTQLPGTG